MPCGAHCAARAGARPATLVKAADIQKVERYVQLAYLFHPYLIANCAAKTTTGEQIDGSTIAENLKYSVLNVGRCFA